MSTIEVRNQAELDEALAKLRPGQVITCVGDGYFAIGGSATVEASGSATVRASGSATVEAWGSATVRASKYVAVTVDRGHDSRAKVQGGVLIEIPAIDTAEAWCEYNGLEIVNGLVMLFKAVGEDWATDYSRSAGIAYVPGSEPAAPDWDGAARECGGGLHGCARPSATLRYQSAPAHFVGIPVRVADIVVHHPAEYPDKVKFPRSAGPVFEVDLDGRRIVLSPAVPS